MFLDIDFDGRIKEYFEDFSKMQKHCGFEIAKAVKKRTDQLRAAQNLSDFLRTGLGHPELLKGDLKATGSVRVTDHYRMIFELPTNDLSPESLRGVDTITVKGVMDYHGTKNEYILP